VRLRGEREKKAPISGQKMGFLKWLADRGWDGMRRGGKKKNIGRGAFTSLMQSLTLPPESGRGGKGGPGRKSREMSQMPVPRAEEIGPKGRRKEKKIVRKIEEKTHHGISLR